jgi:hypothetical protein
MNAARQIGVSVVVLKAHHGSTVERAQLAGEGLVGGIVLNSTVGGANPDAVSAAAALGGRIVWMPTISAPAHIAAHASPGISVLRDLSFSEVRVFDGDELRSEWLPVFDVIAAHDLVLGSAHLSLRETVLAFKAASSRGVQRLLVNHPFLPFLGWHDQYLNELRELDARIELGVMGDQLSEAEISPTEYFVSRYPAELLVFGSDLGHISFPDYVPGIQDWMQKVEPIVGEKRLDDIMKKNSWELLNG